MQYVQTPQRKAKFVVKFPLTSLTERDVQHSLSQLTIHSPHHFYPPTHAHTLAHAQGLQQSDLLAVTNAETCWK